MAVMVTNLTAPNVETLVTLVILLTEVTINVFVSTCETPVICLILNTLVFLDRF